MRGREITAGVLASLGILYAANNPDTAARQVKEIGHAVNSTAHGLAEFVTNLNEASPENGILIIDTKNLYKKTYQKLETLVFTARQE